RAARLGLHGQLRGAQLDLAEQLLDLVAVGPGRRRLDVPRVPGRRLAQLPEALVVARDVVEREVVRDELVRVEVVLDRRLPVLGLVRGLALGERLARLLAIVGTCGARDRHEDRDDEAEQGAHQYGFGLGPYGFGLGPVPESWVF